MVHISHISQIPNLFVRHTSQQLILVHFSSIARSPHIRSQRILCIRWRGHTSQEGQFISQISSTERLETGDALGAAGAAIRRRR